MKTTLYIIFSSMLFCGGCTIAVGHSRPVVYAEPAYYYTPVQTYYYTPAPNFYVGTGYKNHRGSGGRHHGGGINYQKPRGVWYPWNGGQEKLGNPPSRHSGDGRNRRGRR